MKIRKALTIAGSDSGAGAGIQADLKTFAALGVYGASVLTAITAQNTVGVTKIVDLESAMVSAQIDAVMQDIGTNALKTGMLFNASIINTVAAKIKQYRLSNLVVDPVMVATSGDLLLKKNAVAALRNRLLPLTALELNRSAAIEEAARRIVALGARSVVIKGGHRRGPATDLFYDGKHFRELRAPRIRTRHTHGTGCTFSAAITAYLAKGRNIESAVMLAKKFITEAIRQSFAIGAGHSPVHHFYHFWKAESGS